MRRLPILLVVALAFHPMPVRADDCPYAHYGYARETGQIEITTGSMERPADLRSRIPAMEKQGFVVLESEVPRTVTRREHVGGHEVATMLAIAAPAGHWEGGASSNVDLRVIVDRDTLVDCPFSYAYVALDKIAIDPVRRYVILVGHEYTLYFDGFETQKKIDEDWLNARADSMRKLVCGESKK